ncbi:STAS domain-containing protein [Asanoa sp. WMMD1127]|uniref:STAS domain-containing protein n=1 Tax=Asanoa sp. WMMD1127 TaxID=3016107 RepID=UPI002415C4E5|nr:STAS domain-containing protein [Asanoa sp. WMMD1127]MDG4820568.1 STAS domain-containing protein [Asanoa sp. WMMD1127]
MLTTTVTPTARGAVVLVAGELDMDTAPQLATCLDEQRELGRTNLIIDLQELDFCDSRGIATLLTAAKRCQEAGGSVRLNGATGSVARVLDITGVAELLGEGAMLTAWPAQASGKPRPASATDR